MNTGFVVFHNHSYHTAVIILYRIVALIFSVEKKKKFQQFTVTVLSFRNFEIKRPMEERKKVRTENSGTEKRRNRERRN